MKALFLVLLLFLSSTSDNSNTVSASETAKASVMVVNQGVAFEDKKNIEKLDEGEVSTYKVKLKNEIDTTTTLDIKLEDLNVNLASSTFVYTKSNWDQFQNVEVSVPEDESHTSAHSGKLVHYLSEENGYSNLSVGSIEVRVNNNDNKPEPQIDNENKDNTGGGTPFYLIEEKSSVIKNSLYSIPSKLFEINNGEEKTDSRIVEIIFNKEYLDRFGVKQVAFSNQKTFSGSSFEKYKDIKEWALSPNKGEKIVRAKLRTKNGNFLTDTDSIFFSDKIDTNKQLASNNKDKKNFIDNFFKQYDDRSACKFGLKAGKAYKTKNKSSVVFVTLGCRKKMFKSAKTYFSYFDSWSNVGIISDKIMDSLSLAEVNFMPIGPGWDPSSPRLVKTPYSPTVYLLAKKSKYSFENEHSFRELGYNWNGVTDVSGYFLNKYSNKNKLTQNDKHPDGALIKYKNSPKIYYLEDGEKRWIANEKVFNKNNFDWSSVAEIGSSFNYPTGKKVTGKIN